MKRIAFLMLMLATFAAQAQKPVKPNLNKALGFLKDKKFAEAKEMIDAATTYEKTMNDGKTWYYRGLIYSTIDTIKDDNVKALATDPFNVALESFTKAESLAGKSEYFVTGPDGVMPITKDYQIENLSNHYLNAGVQSYQQDNDVEKSLGEIDKSIKLFESQLDKYSNDTLAYYLSALIGQQAEQYDRVIQHAEKYFAKGGKSRDIYLVLYQVYTGPQKDDVKALEVIQQGRKALPTDPVFPKVEIEMLINQGKEAEAKAGLEEAIKKEPNDKLLHLFLGYVNTRLNNVEEARKNFQDALKLDPAYFEAQYHLANTYLLDVDKVVKELNATGNTPADSKKRSALVQQRTAKCEVAIPYFEKAEKLKANDKDAEIELLQKLAQLYYFVADDKNTARVEKKLKDLGVSDE